jgi:hypothetical protein
VALLVPVVDAKRGGFVVLTDFEAKVVSPQDYATRRTEREKG